MSWWSPWWSASWSAGSPPCAWSSGTGSLSWPGHTQKLLIFKKHIIWYLTPTPTSTHKFTYSPDGRERFSHWQRMCREPRWAGCILHRQQASPDHLGGRRPVWRFSNLQIIMCIQLGTEDPSKTVWSTCRKWSPWTFPRGLRYWGCRESRPLWPAGPRSWDELGDHSQPERKIEAENMKYVVKRCNHRPGMSSGCLRCWRSSH